MMLSVNGPGTVPLGAIIPVGNVGAWALPASGEIKDGFALCDGTTFPAGSHPSFAGNRPNLTDDRFLNGASSVGGLGGATSKTTSGIAATFNKNLLNTDQVGHKHRLPLYIDSFGGSMIRGITTSGGDGFYGKDTSTTGTFNLVDLTGETNSGVTTGSVLTVTSDSTTATWNSATVSTTVTQGTISDIRPKYFDVVYLIRVV